jgi:hypothetical protein
MAEERSPGMDASSSFATVAPYLDEVRSVIGSIPQVF